ncbi:hypothetical protein A9974_12175 [Achromobacter sp. UMC71]|nr:hypothetical protein [Achromobacter sp. UMC71]
MTAGGSHHPVLQSCALGIGLGKASGEHNGDSSATLAQLLHDLGRQSSRHCYDGHFRRFGQISHAGIGGQALGRGALRINRHQQAPISLFAHVGNGSAADSQRVVRCANDGDGSGIYQSPQGVTV